MVVDMALEFIGSRQIWGIVSFPAGQLAEVNVSFGGSVVCSAVVHPKEILAGGERERAKFSVDVDERVLSLPISELKLFARLSSGEVFHGRVAQRLCEYFGDRDLWGVLSSSGAQRKAGLSPIFLSKNYSVSKVKKKNVALVTYANAPGAWFPYFRDYYENFLSIDAIFVVTPRPDLFADFNLAGVVGLPGFPFDDGARAVLMSGLVSGLVAYYGAVLVCDVDELLFTPGGAEGLRRILMPLSPVRWGVGIEVLQRPSDRTFDFSLPVFPQRQVGCINHSLTKPMIFRGAVQLTPGNHACNHLPPGDLMADRLFNLHLKYADFSVRERLSEMVSETDYSQDSVKGYCSKSLVDKFHSRVLRDGLEVLSVKDPLVVQDVNSYASHFEFDVSDGLCKRFPRRPLDCLIDLSTIFQV